MTYCGTAQQWNATSFGGYNTALTNATRYYHNWESGFCTLCDTTVDANRDNFVTLDDAVYLLYATMLPEEYPVDCVTDTDGNSTFDADDAIYLLYYCLLPEQYPLG